MEDKHFVSSSMRKTQIYGHIHKKTSSEFYMESLIPLSSLLPSPIIFTPPYTTFSPHLTIMEKLFYLTGMDMPRYLVPPKTTCLTLTFPH